MSLKGQGPTKGEQKPNRKEKQGEEIQKGEKGTKEEGTG